MNRRTTPLPAILTRREAADLARISVRTLDRLGEDGRGPRRTALSARRVGFERRILEEWLTSRTSPVRRGKDRG